jgi:hypothetical protein
MVHHPLNGKMIEYGNQHKPQKHQKQPANHWHI